MVKSPLVSLRLITLTNGTGILPGTVGEVHRLILEYTKDSL